jgi:hypothetical protein
MDLKEVFGVYGKPHRMFVQAMLTRGMVPSNELKKLVDLGAVHVILEVFYLVSNIKIGVEPWMFIYLLFAILLGQIY